MKPTDKNWRSKLYEIIYEADTKPGKAFDVLLLIAILVSIVVVMLESVQEIDEKHGQLFDIVEWIITIFFTIEYIARVVSIKKAKDYIFSFYGVIDLLSTIPMYISFFLVGSHALIALRALRLLRVFRILKLTRFTGASNNLLKSIHASRIKIAVFLFGVLILCVILGTIMYLIEGTSDSGFTSIPRSIYWSIVTLTTVGYGDIAPVTILGQTIASLIMILGYGIIAIPTGIVSVEYAKQNFEKKNINCPKCNTTDHKTNAQFCYQCGETLNLDEK